MEMYLDFPTHANLCVPECQMVGPHNMLPSFLAGSTPQPTASIGLVIGVVIAIVLLAILICCFCLGVKVCKSGMFDLVV